MGSSGEIGGATFFVSSVCMSNTKVKEVFPGVAWMMKFVMLTKIGLPGNQRNWIQWYSRFAWQGVFVRNRKSTLLSFCQTATTILDKGCDLELCACCLRDGFWWLRLLITIYQMTALSTSYFGALLTIRASFYVKTAISKTLFRNWNFGEMLWSWALSLLLERGLLVARAVDIHLSDDSSFCLLLSDRYQPYEHHSKLYPAKTAISKALF